jgi:hypothetical protein
MTMKFQDPSKHFPFNNPTKFAPYRYSVTSSIKLKYPSSTNLLVSLIRNYDKKVHY